MDSCIRLHEGRLCAEIAEGWMGPRPSSSRGQDLDARTTGGRAVLERFLWQRMEGDDGITQDGRPQGSPLREGRWVKDGFPRLS